MIRAIALDDEPLALDVIQAFCAIQGLVWLERTFTRPAEAEAFLKKNPVDLIFLDIQMPALNGIEFYRNLGSDSVVIFTTAFSEYAVEGFNLNAADYLLKPFSYERFIQAVAKARAAIDNKNPDAGKFLFVRADYSLKKIPIADILYIEGLDDYLKIHIENQKTIVARMTMKSMLEKLPPGQFARVHRSYIVQLAKIEKVRNKTVFLKQMEIPVSAGYEQHFMELLKK